MRKVLKKRRDGVIQSYWKGDIEKSTLKNKYFRKVIFTGKDEQLVVMSIPVGEEIGSEVHKNLDQFFRLEQGKAKFVIDDSKTFIISEPGGAAIVKAGTYHNVINVGKKPLQLYALYSRPNHPRGQIDKTRMYAILREQGE